MEVNDSVLKMIPRRASVRTFSKKPLSGDLLARVEKILGEDNTGPFGNTLRFWLVQRDDYNGKRVKLGTYGFISGANLFIAGSMKRHRSMNQEDYGYVMETKILKLTALGLGTCWVGGSFRRGEYAKTQDLMRDEIIPTISPLGFPSEKNGLGVKIRQTFARGRKRKEWEELFSRHDLNTPLPRKEAGRFETALEMVRMAPSAYNFQPWRVVRNGDLFHFFIFRKHSVNRNVGPIDLQRIDIGIAMCHFELALRDQGISGNWVQVPTGILSEANVKYSCSFKVER